MQHLAGAQVADLEAEQVVDVDEHQRAGAVHGEGPDDVAERPDGADAPLRPASATESVGGLEPARYTNRPSAEQIVLCEPERVSIVPSTSPFAASTTCHAGPSNCGT